MFVKENPDGKKTLRLIGTAMIKVYIILLITLILFYWITLEHPLKSLPFGIQFPDVCLHIGNA